MATVLHYVEHWLELSAGFVHGQVARSRHRPVVVSHNATENLAAFPVSPLWRLDPLHRRVPERHWPRVRTSVLRAIAAAHRTQLVHVHFGYVAGDVLPFARASGLPMVLSLHGHDVTGLVHSHPRHYDEIAAVPAAVIVPSRFLRDVVLELGFDAERVHIIPSGVDTAKFTPTALPDLPVVAFVGRLVEKKGIDVLLRAWPTVRRQRPDARLQVLGDGPLAAAVEAAGNGVVRVRPDPSRRVQQVRDHLRAARVVTTPSRTGADGDAESLLLVNLEAQATGRPVVTTRHGGIPEFVDAGASALLVEEADPDALADALVRLLDDSALADRMARNGPAVAARFDVARCVALVDALYDDILARR